MKNNHLKSRQLGKDACDRRKTQRVRRLAAGIFAVGFIVCAVWLIHYFYRLNRADNNLTAIKAEHMQTQPLSEKENASEIQNAEPVSEKQGAEETASVQSTDTSHAGSVSQTAETESVSAYTGLENYAVPEKRIDFRALQQTENADIYAWITVPGTVIDYPIVQHSENPDYYLDYNLDGTRGYPGGIYTQFYNARDWQDANTVIYGHNMKNGTMFAGLHQYEDSRFFEEYPYVYIYSEDKIRVYEIFAAYEYTDINLVTYFGLPGVMSYEEYLKSIYELDGMNNNFNTEITVTAEDKIITLATCISNKPDMRYLVQAVLVAEGIAE